MGIADTIKEQLAALGEAAKRALAQASNINAEDLKRTLQEVVTRAESINSQADSLFDRGLNAVEKSPYTAPIVIGIAFVTLSIGGVIGWAAKAFFG